MQRIFHSFFVFLSLNSQLCEEERKFSVAHAQKFEGNFEIAREIFTYLSAFSTGHSLTGVRSLSGVNLAFSQKDFSGLSAKMLEMFVDLVEN